MSVSTYNLIIPKCEISRIRSSLTLGDFRFFMFTNARSRTETYDVFARFPGAVPFTSPLRPRLCEVVIPEEVWPVSQDMAGLVVGVSAAGSLSLGVACGAVVSIDSEARSAEIGGVWDASSEAVSPIPSVTVDNGVSCGFGWCAVVKPCLGLEIYGPGGVGEPLRWRRSSFRSEKPFTQRDGFCGTSGCGDS